MQARVTFLAALSLAFLLNYFPEIRSLKLSEFSFLYEHAVCTPFSCCFVAVQIPHVFSLSLLYLIVVVVISLVAGVIAYTHTISIFIWYVIFAFLFYFSFYLLSHIVRFWISCECVCVSGKCHFKTLLTTLCTLTPAVWLAMATIWCTQNYINAKLKLDWHVDGYTSSIFPIIFFRSQQLQAHPFIDTKRIRFHCTANGISLIAFVKFVVFFSLSRTFHMV